MCSVYIYKSGFVCTFSLGFFLGADHRYLAFFVPAVALHHVDPEGILYTEII